MKDIALHLRQESKRTDLPLDVIRTLCEAYAEMIRLEEERDEARRMWCESEPVGNCLSVDDMYRRARVESARRGWDCYKSEETQ
jgi:hypothetical protein